MAKVCGKHDVAYQENGSCWCCDQEKTKSAPSTAGKVVPVATGGKK